MRELPGFCKDLSQYEKDTSSLHVSALKFLKALNLPYTHPHCDDRNTKFINYDYASIPYDEGSYYAEVEEEEDDGLLKTVITLCYQVFPALLAMGELWLRLFAFMIVPCALGYLLYCELSSLDEKNYIFQKKEKLVCMIGLISSLVVSTDALYVLQFERLNTFLGFLLMSFLSIRSYMRFLKTKFALRNTLQNSYVCFLFPLIVWGCFTSYLSLHNSMDLSIFRYMMNKELDNPFHDNSWVKKNTPSYEIDRGYGLDIPKAKAGFYYNSNNSKIQSIVQNWDSEGRDYDSIATPYLVTGDAKTGIPFLVNKIPDFEYDARVWVNSEVDEEANALDIFFPEDGIHRQDMPVYLILHGLNGGSDEDYIRDFIYRRRQAGSTCIVMIARGLMGTPVVGWNVFHGARISDVNGAAKAVKKAMPRKQVLAGAGYSMGAIVLGNYVARSGSKCYLDLATIVSGGLKMTEQLSVYRSMRLWQPMLAQELRNTVLGQFKRRYKERLTKWEFDKFMRSVHISSIDRYAVVAYNKFEDLTHYYSEMSAMHYIENVKIPLLVVHALDDPLITVRTLGIPEEVVNKGDGNVLMLITKAGGHVGFPIHNNPVAHQWKWMSDQVSDFTHSYTKK